MAHETHNGEKAEKAKSLISFKSSFWLVVILVGLFIAALNFIKVMGTSEEGKGKKGESTEEMHGGKPAEGTEAKKDMPAADAPKEGEKKAEAPKAEEHK